MRWPVRTRTDETSLAVERPPQVSDVAMPLPSVSLDDLMARLWIGPSTPEPALAMALGALATAPSRTRRPRLSRQLREQRRRPTTKMAYEH
jgi:hypothetical protein